jgi:hypothetical protein
MRGEYSHGTLRPLGKRHNLLQLGEMSRLDHSVRFIDDQELDPLDIRREINILRRTTSANSTPQSSPARHTS